MKQIPESELIINSDGSIFHLQLKPGQLADDVILVGDQARVATISKHFEIIELCVQNREFITHTGYYHGKRMSVISSGIGTDNIDIVINELDALVNIDFETRTEKSEKRSLNLIRIGTSGGLQPYLSAGDYLLSEKAIGFDGLLYFYQNSSEVRNIEFENSLVSHLQYHPYLPRPYVVDAHPQLIQRLGDEFIRGVTISAPGFYGPQGRELRLPVHDTHINEKIADFRCGSMAITNYEMESSAIYGLGNMLGHKAVTVCLIIANRANKTALTNYKPRMEELIELVLGRLAAH